MSLPIHQSAQAYPDQWAYVDRENQIRYADLLNLISDRSVLPLGSIRPGDHIAWCPNNDLASYLTFWAMQHRGIVACPISHRFPLEMRQQVLDRIDAAWLPELFRSGTENFDVHAFDNRNVTNRNFIQPATIVLSSGSTGVPKAIVHTLAAHVASATGAATNMPLIPGDRWLWSLPLFHISGLSILVRCALAGATVVGREAGSELSAELLEQFQITHLSLVGAQLRRLMQEAEFPSPHLKAVLLGGGSVDPKLVAMARRRGVNVLTTYGLTETASQVTTSKPGDAPESSGSLLPGLQMKINSGGQILVCGQTMCLGYYRDGRIQTVVDQEGWFHTKDLGAMDDSGQLRVNGRIDNMFVSGGENIHPENIERAMLAVFEIQQVVVVPKNESVFGARPVAFVLGALPENWETILREELQGYEIPVEIHSWPLAAESTLKVDRKFFRKLLAD